MSRASKNQWLRGALIAGALIAVGMAVCPRPPAAGEADVASLLESTMRAQRSASYTAVARCTETVDGTPVTTDVDFASRKGAIDPKVISLVVPVKPNLAGITPLLEGRDDIAGRPAWILRLKPRSKRAPWTQLWVDKQTGVVLAFRRWSGKGELVRSMKILSIVPSVK